MTSPAAGSRFNATGNITTANAGTRTPGATATLNVLQPPSITKSFNPTSVALNGDSTLTFVLTNLNNVALTGVGFTDTFPVGTSARGAPAPTNTCGGTWQDSGGGGIGNGDAGVRLNNNGTIPANGSCTLTVTVRGTAVGTYNNTSGTVAAAGPIVLTGNTASATLAVGQIGIAKAFGTSPVAVNTNSLLTFTISNSTGAARTGLAFTDTYPAGLVNATPLTVGGTCTGLTHTAVAGGGTFNVTAANVAAGRLHHHGPGEQRHAGHLHQPDERCHLHGRPDAGQPQQPRLAGGAPAADGDQGVPAHDRHAGPGLDAHDHAHQLERRHDDRCRVHRHVPRRPGRGRDAERHQYLRRHVHRPDPGRHRLGRQRRAPRGRLDPREHDVHDDRGRDAAPRPAAT